MAAADYKTSDNELLRGVAQRAESRLAAQLTLAVAADQRALVFAAFLAAIAVALGGGVGSLAMASKGPGFMYVGGVVAFFLGISMLLAVAAARPIPWYIVGSTPSSWLSDIRNQATEDQWLPELCDDLNDRINENDKQIVKNAWFLGAAANIAAATIILGTGSALILAFLA